MDTADGQGASGARYQRPYALPERLDLLRGPSSGTVHLPSHLDWSGNAVYDLDAPGRVVDLYRAVLIEAASPHDPVQLAVGPVLHSDDAVANKVCALFGRALPRDFLDVDAAITSGRYTREELLELAAEADHGFDRLLFAEALGALTQITDAAFAEYRADPATVSDMRHRFAQWRRELLSADPRLDH